HSRQGLGRKIKSEPLTEVELQHLGPGSTDGTVGTRVRRVWSGFCRLRKPRRIGLRTGIAVTARLLNGSDWPPELVSVLSVKEGNRGIGKADVQQCKQADALCQGKVMSQSCGLCDLVPEVLNITIPEHSNQGLLRGTSCAVDESQTFNFIKNTGVLVACQLGRRAGTKFVGARQGKRRDLRPLREIRCREIGWCQLVASRLVSRNERRRRNARSVIASQGQDLSRNGLSYRDAISLILPIRNLR